MKNEWKWIVFFLTLSILVVGILTGFFKQNFTITRPYGEIILHPVRAIIYLAIIFYFTKMSFSLISIMTFNSISSLLFAIINPILIILFTILLYADVMEFATVHKNSGANLLTEILPSVILLGVITIQFTFEVQFLTNFRKLFTGVLPEKRS